MINEMASKTVGIVLSSSVLVIILSVVIYYIIKYVRSKLFGSGLAGPGTRPTQGMPQEVRIPIETLDKNDALFRKTLQTGITPSGYPTFVPLNKSATIITDPNGTQYYVKKTAGYPFDEMGKRKVEYPFDPPDERDVTKPKVKKRLFPIPTKPMQKRVSSGWGDNMISRFNTKDYFPKKQSLYVMDGPINVNEISEPEFTQREIIELFNPSSLTSVTQKLHDYDAYAPHTTNMLGTIKEERGPRRFFTFKK